MTKDGPAPARGAMPQARTGTPDSVLGKRKAEVSSHETLLHDSMLTLHREVSLQVKKRVSKRNRLDFL